MTEALTYLCDLQLANARLEGLSLLEQLAQSSASGLAGASSTSGLVGKGALVVGDHGGKWSR